MSGRKLFVCYRREDSAGHAGRLYDRLNLRFPGRVFMDVAGIGLGTRWGEVIEQTLASCEVVLILIGRRWLETSADGSRRLDDERDPLRAEIAAALRQKLKVVPVLVGGAAMPLREELPDDIAAVADWQAVRIDDDDFDHDTARLTRALEQQLTDDSVDPHLEEEATRRAQIDTLFKNASAAVRAAAWVSAAQTLRSILSLDPGNQRAQLELREVERRAQAAYQHGQTRPVVMPNRGRWAVLGALGALAVVGVIGVSLLIAVIVLNAPSDYDASGPSDGGDQAFPPQFVTEGGASADDDVAMVAGEDATSTAAGVSASLAGQYQLSAYRLNGNLMSVSGYLSLTDAGQGRLRFDTQATNHATGLHFYYRGILQQQDGAWTTTTTESNDPTAVRMPIPTQVQFDGSTLVTANDYGESAVWERQ